MPVLDKFSVLWGRAMQTIEYQGGRIENHDERILVLERKTTVVLARLSLVVSLVLISLPFIFKYLL